MKKIYVTIIGCLFILTIGNLKAQDLIVTNEGDSLNCQITKQRDGIVYFKFLKDGQIKTTLLPVSKVTSIIQAYYAVSNLPSGRLRKQAGYEQWRYGMYGGYGYRMAKISDQLSGQYRDYMKKLRSGYMLGGDIHYFPSEAIGLGIKYTMNKHKRDEGGDFSDNITMHYIAASFLNRYVLANPANSFLLGLNLGFQSYKDKTLALGIGDMSISGNTAGLGMELGFDHKIARGAALHFGLGFTTATLYKIKVKEGYRSHTVKLEKGEYEGLSRLELVVGLKFGK